MSVEILIGDCRERLSELSDQSVHCCVTSPPYFGLRDYGHDEQIGLEPAPEEFVAALVEVFREVRRVLRDDGTVWLNLGDSYASQGGAARGGYDGGILASRPNKAGKACRARVANVGGLKPKDLIGIPWRVAFALQADGWYLRQDIIWHKPNPMPESVRDRCTKAHEYIFMLSKCPRYFYDAEAIKEPAATSDKRKWTDGGLDKQRGHGRRHAGFNGRYAERIEREGAPETRNKRSVWTVATKPFKGAHFATFPPDLIEPCILAGCPQGGTVLDPFGGTGTTGLVAQANGRNAILCELNPEYAALARERIDDAARTPLQRKAVRGKRAKSSVDQFQARLF
ncbi:MAG: site-specific DNA-methyltransferase [Hyphomicrobium sp.]|nr:site-specific DNA-methyltransferase [Hyphomicrobium sp.]